MTTAATVAVGCLQVVTGGAALGITSRTDFDSHRGISGDGSDRCGNGFCRLCDAPTRASAAVSGGAIASTGVCWDRAG